MLSTLSLVMSVSPSAIFTEISLEQKSVNLMRAHAL